MAALFENLFSPDWQSISQKADEVQAKEREAREREEEARQRRGEAERKKNEMQTMIERQEVEKAVRDSGMKGTTGLFGDR